MIEEFEVDAVDGPLPAPSYNVAPTDAVPAVWSRPCAGAPGQFSRQLTALKWGLVPSWTKAPRRGAPLINARLETVADKPSFRKALSVRRCLLPSLGYYEWYDEPTSAGAHRRQPVFIRPSSGELFVMAGLYEFWRDEGAGSDAEWVRTCAIITTRATDGLGRIHDRMPVTIPSVNWEAWLSADVGGRAALDLINPNTGAGLVTHPVSTMVNSVRNNGPELVVPLSMAE